MYLTFEYLNKGKSEFKVTQQNLRCKPGVLRVLPSLVFGESELDFSILSKVLPWV